MILLLRWKTKSRDLVGSSLNLRTCSPVGVQSVLMTKLCVSEGIRSNAVLNILTKALLEWKNACNCSIIRLFNCCIPCILHRTFSWSTIDEMKYICWNLCGSFGVGTIEPCKWYICPCICNCEHSFVEEYSVTSERVVVQCVVYM